MSYFTKSPKMYYLPDELAFSGNKVINISFINSDIVLPDVVGDYIDHNFIVTVKTYEKVFMKNCGYEFLWVDINQMEDFRKMYFGEK